jgi:hypothetical protein
VACHVKSALKFNLVGGGKRLDDEGIKIPFSEGGKYYSDLPELGHIQPTSTESRRNFTLRYRARFTRMPNLLKKVIKYVRRLY